MAGLDKGKFIVIDGSDGSGKTTQLNLLKNYLDTKKTPVTVFDFPQYKTFHGETVGRFLAGEFGPLDSVSPYLLAYPYAMDRLGASPHIKAALTEGKIVLANRYVASNLAHQSGRLPKNERRDFVDWDIEFEYYLNGLPREDLLIYLYVPQAHAAKLLKNRSKKEYVNGKTKDIVENDKKYLTDSEEAYLDLLQRFDHWIKIDCVNEKQQLLSKEEIHEKIKLELISRNMI
jgi:dTMP kinase